VCVTSSDGELVAALLYMEDIHLTVQYASFSTCLYLFLTILHSPKGYMAVCNSKLARALVCYTVDPFHYSLC